MQISRNDFFLAIFAALIWGMTFPITSVALETTPPIFFAFLRFLCASAFVVVVPKPKVDWKILMAVGLFLGAGQYGFLFVSMTNGISAGMASLLVHTQAFFTIGISMFLFSERVLSRQIVALLLALTGLACLVVDRSEVGALDGLLFVLLAASCGAIGNNILKWLGSVDMLGVAVWMSVASPLPLLGLSFYLEWDGSRQIISSVLSWSTLGAVLYSAILATVAVFAIWGRLLATYSAVMVAPFFLLVPVFGIGLSALFLGERLTRLQVSGALLVFLGLALALWPRRLAEGQS